MATLMHKTEIHVRKQIVVLKRLFKSSYVGDYLYVITCVKDITLHTNVKDYVKDITLHTKLYYIIIFALNIRHAESNLRLLFNDLRAFSGYIMDLL